MGGLQRGQDVEKRDRPATGAKPLFRPRDETERLGQIIEIQHGNDVRAGQMGRLATSGRGVPENPVDLADPAGSQLGLSAPRAHQGDAG